MSALQKEIESGVKKELAPLLAALESMQKKIDLLAAKKGAEVLNRQEAALWLGCSVGTIDKMCREGRLKYIMRGGTRRFLVDDLMTTGASK